MAAGITAKFFGITHNRSRLSLSLPNLRKCREGWDGGVWSSPAASGEGSGGAQLRPLLSPCGHEWRCWLWVPPLTLAVPLSQGLLSPFCLLAVSSSNYTSFCFIVFQLGLFPLTNRIYQCQVSLSYITFITSFLCLKISYG